MARIERKEVVRPISPAEALLLFDPPDAVVSRQFSGPSQGPNACTEYLGLISEPRTSMEQDPVMDRLSRPRSHASLWRWISPSGTMWTEHERGVVS